MTLQTPKYSIPYPELLDLIAKLTSPSDNILTDFQAMALATESGLGSVEQSALIAAIESSAASGGRLEQNIVPNSAPYEASPTWPRNYGTNGAGGIELILDTSAPSKVGRVRMTWTTGQTGGTARIQSPAGVAGAGKTYSAAITVRSSVATRIGAALYFYDGSGAQVGSTQFNRLYNLVPNEWTVLELSGITSPAGTVSARVGAAQASGATVFPVGAWLDACSAIVSEGSTVPEWFDGSEGNAYWVGAVNQSESVAVVPEEAPFGHPGTAPMAAKERTGKFYRNYQLYIPAGADLGPMRRRISHALTGKSLYSFAWAGHSIVAGQGGTPGVVDNVRLLERRAEQAGKASCGIVYAQNGTTQDARITMSSGWVKLGSPRGNMQSHVGASVPGETYTHVSNNNGTVVEIYTFGNSSPMTYSIDGGAAVTITPSGASAGQITRVTGLADTTHTVVITTTSTTTAYVLGVSVTYPTGLRVANLGYSGSIAYDWSPGGSFFSGYRNIDETLKPDGVALQIVANHLIHGVGTASLISDLTASINAHKAAGRDVILVMDPPIEDATRTTWYSAYMPAIYQIADATGTPLVDFTALWVNRSLADMQGFYFDQWHPDDLGYLDLHWLMANVLLP